VDTGSSREREALFLVRGDVAPEVLARSLGALLPIRHRHLARRTFAELDTFDGRIRRAGARLTQSTRGTHTTLAWHPHGRGPRLTVRVDRTVRFAWDLPPGPLLDAVGPVIGVRCLIPLAEVEQSGSVLEVLDERGKTTARVRIESGRARPTRPRSRWRELPTMVVVTGLRGYEDAFERLVPIVSSRPGLEPFGESVQAEVLRVAGVPERADRSVPRLSLPFTIQADAGARCIHRALFDLMAVNEPGLRENLDTEFLHDFRVAIRRTRSLLGQIRHVFPPDAVEHFAAEFSWLGRTTGPARDTDVLSLTLRSHAGEIAAADMAVLHAFVAEAQQREHRQLVEALDSDRYRRLMREWKAFLDHPRETAEAPNAGRLLRDVVAQRARRLALRIADAARSIDAHTEAARLHQVRIDAKKLRYLVDVTPGFSDAASLARVLSALKKLQRVLGEFNDANVQEARLLDCGHALGAAGGNVGAVLALGRLAEQSRHRRERLRGPIVGALAKFRSKRMRDACRLAFARPPAEDGVP
jgi:CHAD domain-containing protein